MSFGNKADLRKIIPNLQNVTMCIMFSNCSADTFPICTVSPQRSIQATTTNLI